MLSKLYSWLATQNGVGGNNGTFEFGQNPAHVHSTTYVCLMFFIPYLVLYINANVYFVHMIYVLIHMYCVYTIHTYILEFVQ